MEKLSQEQQESLRKTSNERLRVMAARISSVSDEEIAVMDRSALLQVVFAGSTASAEGEKDVTPSGTAHKPTGEVEVQLELRRAELELRKAEIDAEDRKAERESRKAELEAENKKAERESRKAELEAEDRKAEREIQLRMRQMEIEEKKKKGRTERTRWSSI